MSYQITANRTRLKASLRRLHLTPQRISTKLEKGQTLLVAHFPSGKLAFVDYFFENSDESMDQLVKQEYEAMQADLGKEY